MVSCPDCQSSNVRKLSVVYQEGRSTVDLSSTSTAVGAGISSSGLGVGVAKGQGSTIGVQQTELSKRATPPPYSALTLPPEPRLAEPDGPGESIVAFGFLLFLASAVVWFVGPPLYAKIILVAGLVAYSLGQIRRVVRTEAELETFERDKQQLSLDYDKKHKQWKLNCEKAREAYANNPLAVWNRSYMCMSCGRHFDPTK